MRSTALAGSQGVLRPGRWTRTVNRDRAGGSIDFGTAEARSEVPCRKHAAASCRGRPSPQLAEHFVVFGKAVDFVLAENQLAVDDHVEHAACTLDQLGRCSTLVLDCFGQTGRGGQVVSLHAVGDRDVHSACLLPGFAWFFAGQRLGRGAGRTGCLVRRRVRLRRYSLTASRNSSGTG